MSDFTLDDLNKAIQAKYKPWVFTAGRNKFVLNQVLSLPREQRAVVREMLDSLDNDKDNLDEDKILATLKAILEFVVEDGKAGKLFEVLDDDLVKVSALFEAWMESTKVGEA